MLLVASALVGTVPAAAQDSGISPEFLASIDRASLAPLHVFNRFQALGRKFLFVHGAGDSADAYREEIDRSHWGSSFAVTHQAGDRPPTPAQLADTALWVAGTAASNAYLAALAPTLPFAFEEGGFRFQGRRYDHPDDVMVLRWHRPDAPTHALVLAVGNRDAAVLRHAAEMPQVFDYIVYRGDQRLRLGRLDHKAVPWRFDKATDRDVERETTVRTLGDGRTARVHGKPEARAIERYLAREKAQLERLARLIGKDAAAFRSPRTVLWEKAVDQALFAHNARATHADPDAGEAHVALDSSPLSYGPSAAVVLALRGQLGAPSHAILESGLAVHTDETWRGKGWRYWAARVHAADMTIPLATLLNPDRLDHESSLAAEALAASLVDFLLGRWGRESFLTHYRRWQPSPAELADLETAWHRRLAKNGEALAPRIARDRALFPKREGFHRGFNYTHEALFDVRNGYLGRAASAGLDAARDLGTDAVAIVPYGLRRPENVPQPIRFLRGAIKENDETILFAIRDAQTRGMSVMLKPQLEGGWPGHIEMASDAGWRSFFDHYERWILHYALMAELAGVEVFCLGVELVKATEHEAAWRKLAARARSIYSGDLVYAANWGEEFERVAFWDAFDFIGVDSYYPLSSEDEPSDKALTEGARAAARRIQAVADRFGKPILLTEIGYTSSPTPWKDPWVNDHSQPANAASQARAYRAMIAALGKIEALAGVYWWRWLSNENQGPKHAGYTPRGKPAEALIGKWFKSRATP